MTKHAISLEIRKNKVDIVLKIKVSKEIEMFFKELALAAYPDDSDNINENGGHLQQSSKWYDEEDNGLMFYRVTDKMSEKLDDLLGGKIIAEDGRRLMICNNFGSGLYENDRLNIAILRAVNAAEGITLKTTDLLGYEEIKRYIEDLASITKEFYRNFLQKAKVKAKISFEV